MADTVKKNVVVTLQYNLYINDDELLEGTTPDDPLMYLHGHENIIPGLEKALEGMKIGDTKRVTIAPVDGYGARDEDAIETIDRGELPPDLEPHVGMQLEVMDEDGWEEVVEIIEVDEETVTIDFNHPLAGIDLTFEVEITGLRDADDTEIDHGHVHVDGGHEH